MLKDLAIQFRFLQLYAHNAHNLVVGQSFFSDHEFLGELYGKYESSYDASIERLIGLGAAPDLNEINAAAFAKLSQSQPQESAEAWLSVILAGEMTIGQLVEQCFLQKYSQGTKNLIAQFGDDSESRIYKIQQRLK